MQTFKNRLATCSVEELDLQGDLSTRFSKIFGVFFFRNSRLQREDLLSRHYRHSVEFHYLINDNSIHDFQIYW